MTEPYSSLAVLPPNHHGWFMPENRRGLARLVGERGAATVMELGSWLGASTCFLAGLLPEGGKLYAVDTWQGSREHHENAEWAAMLPTLYQQFLSNVVHAGLTERIVPVRMSALEARGRWPSPRIWSTWTPATKRRTCWPT